MLNLFSSGPNSRFRDEPVLTTETESEISSRAPIEARIKTIKTLSEVVLCNKLEKVICFVLMPYTLFFIEEKRLGIVLY